MQTSWPFTLCLGRRKGKFQECRLQKSQSKEKEGHQVPGLLTLNVVGGRSEGRVVSVGKR